MRSIRDRTVPFNLRAPAVDSPYMDRPQGSAVAERTDARAENGRIGGDAILAPRRRQRDPFGAIVSFLAALHRWGGVTRAGVTGERLVGFVLGRLPEGWHVFRGASPADGGSDGNHVVVGPGGVFTVHTKDLMGKVWVAPGMVRHNGHPTDYLRQAAHEARRKSRLLGAAAGYRVEVRGVVAILAVAWTITLRPVDVLVGSTRSVRDWLLRLPATLSARDVARIAALTDARSTWIPSGS
jgi:hypothetical protein